MSEGIRNSTSSGYCLCQPSEVSFLSISVIISWPIDCACFISWRRLRWDAVISYWHLIGCVCLALIDISLTEKASPVWIERVYFLSISIYTLINTSLVNGAGHVYIKGVDFSQQLYPHWTLLSFGSNRMNNYNKLYTCFRMKTHHLPDVATSRSRENRCKCVWLIECPYDI